MPRREQVFDCPSQGGYSGLGLALLTMVRRFRIAGVELDSLGVPNVIDQPRVPSRSALLVSQVGFAAGSQRSMPKQYRYPSNVPMYTRPFAMEMPPQWFQLAIWSPLDQSVLPVRASKA